MDVLRNLCIIKYAFDTILYVAGNIDITESHLSDDLNLLSECFKENEPCLNLKKGETESMIFGTTKHLAMLNRDLKVKHQHRTVNVTTSYR